MTRRDQRLLLRRVLQTYTKTVDLEGALLLKGETELAATVASRANALRREVDRLRRAMWSRWSGSAARVDEALRARNARLQATIRDIERDVRTADRVVRAVAIVAEVLTLTRKLGVS